MSDPTATLKGLKLMQQAQQLRAARQVPAAAATYAQALALLPNHPALLADYGAFAEETRNWQVAEQVYRQLGALRPDCNFEGKLGLSLFRQERYSDAIPWLRTHLSRHPDEFAVKLPLAQALLKELRWEEALELGEQMLPLRPDLEAVVELVVNCRYNLGQKEPLDAMAAETLAAWPRSPLIRALLGFHLLKNHDFARGFDYQQAIRRRYETHKPDMDRPAAAGWDGKPFDGLLLIDGEQGLGEEIIAAAMFSDLVKLGQRTVISCDPRLIPLFKRSFPSLEFVDRYGTEMDRLAAGETRHFRFPALDLACLFRRAPFQHGPWLVADPQRVADLRERYEHRAPGLCHMGISWRTVREVAGSPRSIRLVELAPLLRLPGIDWFNAQYGDYSEDVAALTAAKLPIPWDDLYIDQTKDLDGLSAQLCAIDGLVSISNTTVHLAGALGVPAWLILPKTRPVMWYWGYSGDTTPWYPSIRIKRNTVENDWRALALSLADDLFRFSLGKGSAR